MFDFEQQEAADAAYGFSAYCDVESRCRALDPVGSAPRGSPVMLMAGLDHVSCLMPAILWSPKVAEPVLQLTRVQLYPRKRSMIDPTRHAAIMHIGHRTCHVASDRLDSSVDV